MSSYVCGKNVGVQFYYNDLSTETWGDDESSSGAGNTRNAKFSPNDTLTSLFLTAYDAEGSIGAVTLYEHVGCEGR